MKIMRLASAVLAVGVLLSRPVPARATTLEVDDDRVEAPTAPWTSIQPAIDAAVRGDTIRVFPGTYNEQLVITKDLSVLAVDVVGLPVIIQPFSLIETRPSVLKESVEMAAGILVDGVNVTIDGFELDMSMSGLASCSPLLTGVYLRNADGAVRHMFIHGVRPVGLPDCDSGIALYVESGKAGEFFGEPVFGTAHVHVVENVYADYQKAGLVANGTNTVVSGRGDQAFGAGATAGAVQYGFQVGGNAKGRLRRILSRDHASTIAGKTAAGVLGYRARRLRLSQAVVLDSQTGMFVVGDRAASLSGAFENMTDDGVVFLGDTNLSLNSNVHVIGNSGVFINGYRNSVRSGFMSDMLVGVWIYRGLLNRFTGIRFQDVPIAKQGVYGGERDLDATHTAPVLACGTHTDCDDGNACTYDVCDLERALCYYVDVVCEDFNVCTDDSCDVLLGCQNVANALPCDDASVCTVADVCAAGVCGGTPVVCDDLNTCTTDSCDPVLGCQTAPVLDGTPCGILMTCLAGVCS